MPRYGVLPYSELQRKTSENTVIMNLSICSPSSSQLIFIYSAWMMCEQTNQTERLGDGFSCLACAERDKQADFVGGHRGPWQGTKRTGGKCSWGRRDKGRYCNFYTRRQWVKISPRRCERREGTGECQGGGSSNMKARTSLGHLRKNPKAG